MSAAAEQLPHRQKYLEVVGAFLRRYLALHLELVDDVERACAAPHDDASS